MRKGSAFLLVGFFLLLFGIALFVFSFIMMGASPDDYDSWVTDDSRTVGDEITITGVLAEEDESGFFGINLYYTLLLFEIV